MSANSDAWWLDDDTYGTVTDIANKITPKQLMKALMMQVGGSVRTSVSVDTGLVDAYVQIVQDLVSYTFPQSHFLIFKLFPVP